METEPTVEYLRHGVLAVLMRTTLCLVLVAYPLRAAGRSSHTHRDDVYFLALFEKPKKKCKTTLQLIGALSVRDPRSMRLTKVNYLPVSREESKGVTKERRNVFHLSRLAWTQVVHAARHNEDTSTITQGVVSSLTRFNLSVVHVL